VQSEWNDEFGEDEYGDGADSWQDEGWGTDDEEPADTIPCGHCGADVYEEAEQCPRCGEWITRHSSPLTGRPLWWQLIGLLGVIAVILALLQ
jgi:hypothetical protein